MRAREAILPPSLHPTIPAALSLQVWSVGASPWGAFRLAMVTRGVSQRRARPRLHVGALIRRLRSACDGVRSHVGFSGATLGRTLRHGYDGVDARVVVAGREILTYPGARSRAHGHQRRAVHRHVESRTNPNGIRLVQLEADHAATRVERLSARLSAFRRRGMGQPVARSVPRRVGVAGDGDGRVSADALRLQGRRTRVHRHRSRSCTV